MYLVFCRQSIEMKLPAAWIHGNWFNLMPELIRLACWESVTIDWSKRKKIRRKTQREGTEKNGKIDFLLATVFLHAIDNCVRCYNIRLFVCMQNYLWDSMEKPIPWKKRNGIKNHDFLWTLRTKGFSVSFVFERKQRVLVTYRISMCVHT